MTRVLSLALVFGIAFLVVGCSTQPVEDKQFHTAPESPNIVMCIQTNGVRTETCADSDKHRLRIPFQKFVLEYGETLGGAPFNQRLLCTGNLPDGASPEDCNRTQIEILQSHLIKAVAGGRPVYLVVYVHGWHHNASPDDDNFIKFNDLLARVTDQLQRNGQFDHQVVGVYVGWRGQSVSNDGVIGTLSAKDRAAAADTIATGTREGKLCSGPSCKRAPLHADLAKVFDTLGLPEDKGGAQPNRNLVLLIGHSLGGRILSTMYHEELTQAEDYFSDRHATVITVNAAVDAALYDDIFRSPGAKPFARGTVPAPSWINITSKDDWVTRKVFRLGRWVGLIPLSHEHSTAFPERATAIGHYEEFITHTWDVQHLALTSRELPAAKCPYLLAQQVDAAAQVSCRMEYDNVASSVTDGFGNPYQFLDLNGKDCNGKCEISAAPLDALKWWQADWDVPDAAETVTHLAIQRERDQNWLTRKRSSRFYAEQKDQSGSMMPIDTEIRALNFKRVRDVVPFNGRLWNIRATDNILDIRLTNGSEKFAGVHNGYVSTDLIRAVVELSIRSLPLVSARDEGR